MNRAYIAAPIFNPDQLAVVRSITIMLKLLEVEYFSPYENSQGIWQGRAPKDCTPEERGQVLDDNIINLDWAQILICWVGGTDDGKADTGVTWEMGHFNALKRYGGSDPQTIRFTLAYIEPNDKRQNMNLMLAGTVDAVAFGPAQLHRGLELLRNDDRQTTRRILSPDKQIAHEKEPIV
jgi:nucleoside 2-deoxyribosyltransferase